MAARLTSSAFALTLSLLACGVKDVGPKEQVIVSSENIPKVSPTKEGTHQLPNIDYVYSQVAALSELEKIQSEIRFVSKSGESKFVFSLANGTAYVYDDATELVSYLPAVVTPSQGERVYLLEGNSGWVIHDNKITNFSPKSSDTVMASQIAQLSVDWAAQSLSPLFISPSQILLKGEGILVFVSKKDQSELQIEKISATDALAESLTPALSAGFTPDMAYLWITNASQALFFKRATGGTGFEDKPFQAELISDLPKGAVVKNVAVDFDNNKNPVGRIILFADGKILVSGRTPLASNLSWEIDIRPISEQYCLNCHGVGGAGGFSKADEAASWTGIKRESIIARVAEQKSMPPPNSPAGMAMTSAQRDKIKNWLNSGSLSGNTGASSGSSGSGGTPPTPGPTWTTVIQPLLSSKCVGCHSTYTTFSVVYETKTRIIQKLSDRTMPPSTVTMTDTERSEIISYLNALQ